MLIFSLFFYAYDIPWFIIPLLISASSDYLISKELINNKFRKSKSRFFLLFLSILINISLLIIFKYSLFISQANPFLNDLFLFENLNDLILPAGISFYTFQTLSFTIDSFNKKIINMPKFINYFFYVSYFPQLVAGPILRPHEFFNEKSELIISEQNTEVSSGFSRICIGLFLKLCLADELARMNDIAFSYDSSNLGFFDSWTMAFGFGLQIYFDFSAYSHMAIGISKILGLPIKENFNFPYSSTSVSKFWKRWHISLSSWVSDYLYLYLNRKLPSYFFGMFPLLITWSVMGIWHGASWRFALWGLLNGIFILIYRYFKSLDYPLKKTININPINSVLTILPIMSSWIFFRATTWDQAINLYKSLFQLSNLNFGLRENYYLLVFILSILTLTSGYLNQLRITKLLLRKDSFKIFFSGLALSLALIFINRQSSFIYFQF